MYFEEIPYKRIQNYIGAWQNTGIKFIMVLNSNEAELSKLLENHLRYTQITTMNLFKDYIENISGTYGFRANPDNIFEAMRTKGYINYEPGLIGGGWMRMDKSAHLSYLSTLAHQGFVVCSVEYRTSNEGCYPMQIEDVKAAIRYLKAHADRYRIDKEHFGAMGESAGGFLTCMAALDHDKARDVGEYLEESSSIQAACPWYPPTNLSTFKYKDAEECAASMESLLLGYNIMRNIKEAYNSSPVSKVTKDAPPFLIIHGINDQTVPFEQSEELYDKLIENGCDADLIALEGADHADMQFFQDELWDRIIEFFKTKLG
jgi:acetyl esterase/lipase